MPDPVVHFEIPADDPDRARRFYTGVFGWKADSVPGMGYTIFHTGPTDEKGMLQRTHMINGGMFKRPDFAKGPVLTVQVDDLDAASARIRDSGGKVLRGSQEVPGVGRTAYFADPEGNVLGLIEPVASRRV